MEKYAILYHLLHMLGMLSFCLLFGIILRPAIRKDFGQDDKLLNSFWLYSFVSSILLGLDIFIMEIMIALSMLPVLPVAAALYCFTYWWRCSNLRTAMNFRIESDEDSEENEENDSLCQFRNGAWWQQLLLFIYKHNKITFKKKNFRDHCEEIETEVALSPGTRTQDDSYFNYEETKEGGYHRESFITNDQTRKDSEINLVDNDTSLTPVRVYDECLTKFIEDIQEEFDLEDEEEDKKIKLKKWDSEINGLTSKLKTQKRPRINSNLVEIKERKFLKKKESNSPLSSRPIKGRLSMKKIDRGIVCTICQDDLNENDIVLQLDWGNTHMLHFGWFREWISFKLEWPSWRTNLQKLYKPKIVEDLKKRNILKGGEEYMYAEDLLPLKQAKDTMLSEIAQLERENLLEEGASSNILRNI